MLCSQTGHGFLKKNNNDLRREVETLFLRKLFDVGQRSIAASSQP